MQKAGSFQGFSSIVSLRQSGCSSRTHVVSRLVMIVKCVKWLFESESRERKEGKGVEV